MQSKSRLVLNVLKTGPFDPEFSRADVLEHSPLAAMPAMGALLGKMLGLDSPGGWAAQ
jgi:hypothetical protein